uniref:Uncharacterized protein n=1 Tax=Salarias fasciatus TaxID=181472 RepID=A0A672F5H4_SALFA
MRYAMLFLVLTLVVFLAEPAECGFRSWIKKTWKKIKNAFRGEKDGAAVHNLTSIKKKNVFNRNNNKKKKMFGLFRLCFDIQTPFFRSK